PDVLRQHRPPRPGPRRRRPRPVRDRGAHRAARHRDRGPAEGPARSPEEDRYETVSIYLPATMAGLARLRDDGSLPASAERYVADGDGEEEEDAALEAEGVGAAGVQARS